MVALPGVSSSHISTETTSAPTQWPSDVPAAQAEHRSLTSVDTQTGIGIGIGIAAAIILLVLLLTWLCARRRKSLRARRTKSKPSERSTFDSVGSTLVSTRLSVPLKDLHEVHGKDLRRGSEMMTPANSHEASALPPTRDGAPAAELPTIWNEGYRGRPGSQIRRDSEFTVQVSDDGLQSERPASRATRASEVTGESEDARYTFLID